MGRLGGALHAYALDTPDPSDVLLRVGRLAEVDAALATGLYAVLDPTTGTIDLASAGHLPPLVGRPRERIGLPLDRRGPLAAARVARRLEGPVAPAGRYRDDVAVLAVRRLG